MIEMDSVDRDCASIRVRHDRRTTTSTERSPGFQRKRNAPWEQEDDLKRKKTPKVITTKGGFNLSGQS